MDLNLNIKPAKLFAFSHVSCVQSMGVTLSYAAVTVNGVSVHFWKMNGGYTPFPVAKGVWFQGSGVSQMLEWMDENGYELDFKINL